MSALKGMNEDTYGRSKKNQKVSYFCDDCNGWHTSTGTKKKTYNKNKTVSISPKVKKYGNKTLVIRNFNK